VYGQPVGLQALHEVTAKMSIPVLALGGIKPGNYRETLAAGAAGVAAISLFSETKDLIGLVNKIKAQE
jgi:thiamine monophosphate synthase